MERVPYASVVGSLMYAQVCTHPDISYAVNVLGRYLSNPSLGHWKSVKKVMRYLQGTKDYMLTYKKSNQLQVISYSDYDSAGCPDDRKSTSDIRTYFVEECENNSYDYPNHEGIIRSFLRSYLLSYVVEDMNLASNLLKAYLGHL